MKKVGEQVELYPQTDVCKLLISC